ncbi:hypothetical protein ACICHK_29620 [Streptomyces sp. AHU1]|uniref:hypothetical protein n=1 Tax=Streptomyces sp. AHU1 TaxID=3377215 RepID=UPI003877EF8F
MHRGPNERQQAVLDRVGQGSPDGVWPDSTYYADQLLEELAANDGCLIKLLEPGPHAVNWASRVSAARKSGKIPRTQELYGYRTHRGYEIKLVDIPAWRLAELTPLPVPARLAKPHAVVTALQKQPQPMGLTRPVQGRALRIIQSLITATEKQGHKAALGTTQGAPPPHRRRKAPPHFTITAQGESVGFLVLQEQDRSEHVPTDKELAEAKKYSWMRIARFDCTPSNRLRLILRGGNPHRASEWTDLPDQPLAPSHAPDRIRHSSTRPHHITATRAGEDRDRGVAHLRRRPRRT